MAKQSAPSQPQIDLIEKLSLELGEQNFFVPDTSKAASKHIDELIAKCGVLRAAQKAAQKAVEQDAMAGTPTWEQVVALVGARPTMRGKFVKVTLKHGNYGAQVKGLFVDDESGRKVWTTVPAAIADHAARLATREQEYALLQGLPVELTVSVTPSDDDPYFGFGKKPAGQVLEVPADSPAAKAQAEYAQYLLERQAEKEAYAAAQHAKPWDTSLFVPIGATTGAENQHKVVNNWGQGLTMDYIVEWGRDTAMMARTHGIIDFINQFVF